MGLAVQSLMANGLPPWDGWLVQMSFHNWDSLFSRGELLNFGGGVIWGGSTIPEENGLLGCNFLEDQWRASSANLG